MSSMAEFEGEQSEGGEIPLGFGDGFTKPEVVEVV